MHPQIDDWEGFEIAVSLICTVYAAAKSLFARKINVVCVDEKTGMAANESIRPTLRAKPGKRRCDEPEYTRHGVQCLTANRLVATGEVIRPTIALTRTAKDFLKHIKQTIADGPKKGWIFVLDNLNTHCSAELCIWINKVLGLNLDLGVKGKSGILENQRSRKEFLSDPDHRIQFIYTPRHCSWLNQIECWFSTLQRKVLRGASFKSKEHLRTTVLAFIEQHNASTSPYKWTAKVEDIVVKVAEALYSVETSEVLH